jgi:hypothetical protein
VIEMMWIEALFIIFVTYFIIISIFGLGRLKERARPSKKSVNREYIINTFKISIVLTLITMLIAIFTQTAMLFIIIASALIGMLIGLVLTLTSWTKRSIKIILTTIFIIFVIYAFITYTIFASVNNTYYLNSQIKFKNINELFSGNTFPIDKIPLVNLDYARAIASSHLSVFGGSVQIADYEQIIHNGYPYWIFTIESTNTLATPYTYGFILVSAVDGSYIIIKQKSAIAPGLWLDNNIEFHTYLRNSEFIMGNYYPQPIENDTIFYVQTLLIPRLDGGVKFAGGVIYNPDGTINSTYTSIYNAPRFINQPWDREMILQIAKNWGEYRSGNGTFNIFAGGFLWIPASPYRLQVSGSELIPYGNETGLLIFFSPANAPNTLAGVMVISGTKFYYYDASGLNLISPIYAKTTVQSKLPALSQGRYVASNPILYPIGKYFAWIVPYYYENEVTNIVQLQGIGILDAFNAGHMILTSLSSSATTSEDIKKLLETAIENFSNATMIQSYQVVRGKVTDIKSWIQNGETYIAIQINGTKYYIATPSSVSLDQWLKIMNIKIDDNIIMKVKDQSIIEIITP